MSSAKQDALSLVISISRFLQKLHGKYITKFISDIKDLFDSNPLLLMKLLANGISTVKTQGNKHKSSDVTFLKIASDFKEHIYRYLSQLELSKIKRICSCIYIDINNGNKSNLLYLLLYVGHTNKYKSELNEFKKHYNEICDEKYNNLIFSLLKKGITKLKQTHLLMSIQNLLPKIKINDSITKSQTISNSEHDKYSNKMTFLTIPSDVKIVCIFQYLEEKDLYVLEKICRSICIDARNPNSLYKIIVNCVNDMNHYTHKKRYQR
eukprot:116587_1